MKSLFKLASRRVAKMNKKGQIVNTISSTAMSIMMLIFVIFAVLFGIATLNPSSFFTANSAEANSTGYLTGNLTQGVGSFGGSIPTLFKVLGVVVVLGAIALLILYLRRMQQVGGTGQNTGI